MPRIIDLSVSIDNNEYSDHPGGSPKVTYRNHSIHDAHLDEDDHHDVHRSVHDVHLEDHEHDIKPKAAPPKTKKRSSPKKQSSHSSSGHGHHKSQSQSEK